MTTPRSPHKDDDFRQLTGAFDRPIAPSPRFADELKARLEQETFEQQATTAAARPISRRTARAASTPPMTRRRRLDIAIAAALIVAMLGGSFWYAEMRVGENGHGVPEATRYAAQPLSASSTPEPGSAVSSDPGLTLNFLAGFDPTRELNTITLDNAPTQPINAAVGSDTLVVGGTAPEWTDVVGPVLAALDLPSGSLLWATELAAYGGFHISGDRIVGVFAEHGEAEYAMMSLSLADGSMIWRGEDLVVYGGEPMAAIPPSMSIPLVIVEDAVYYADPEGTITALNADNGEMLWSLPLERPIGISGPQSAVSVVGDENFLYAVDHENAVRKIDRHTGEVADHFQLADRPPSELDTDLHLKGDVLVALSHPKPGVEGVAYVDALSTSDGDSLWTHRLGSAGAFITVTDQVVAIPRTVGTAEIEAGSDIPEPGAYVSYFDLNTGEPVALYGPSDWGYSTVSSSGEVVCINEGMAITCTDSASDDPQFVVLPFSPGYRSISPLLFWNDAAIVLTEGDGVAMIQPKDVQPQRAQSNAIDDARGGQLGGTSDRAIVNPDLNFPEAPLTHAWSGTVSDPIWVMPYTDVVVSLGSSELMVQDAATGDILWAKSTEDAFRNETNDTERNPQLLLAQRQGRPIALPWIEGKTLYYATTTELVGVDLRSGDELFRTIHTVPDDTSDVDQMFFPWDMAVKDGVAYVLTVPAPGYYALQAIDLVTGESLWIDETGDPVQDWSLAQTLLNQLIVTKDLVIMQALEDETISILALNRSDGSPAWERESPFPDERVDRNISAINDTYLVQTSHSTPTGIENGTPEPDQTYGVALLDLSSGELLWEDTEGAISKQESGLCLVVPGWDDTALYISCATEKTLTMFRYPFAGNGAVERVGTWETPGLAEANIYNGEAAYFNTGNDIVRVDLRGGETSTIPLEGGETCNGLLATDTVVLCVSDDNLGTYTIQAYTTGPVATP